MFIKLVIALIIKLLDRLVPGSIEPDNMTDIFCKWTWLTESVYSDLKTKYRLYLVTISLRNIAIALENDLHLNH